MRLVALLLLGLLSNATARAAEPTIADPFSVKEVPVDVVARNATEAREAGIRTAQRRAWRELWARLTGEGESSAPDLDDASLSRMVAGVDVVMERFSSQRYIARLTVDFDPSPVRATIGQMGIGPQGRKSHPILLLPVLKDGGAWSGVDPRSPWFQAWTAFGDVRSAIDYVRVTGTPADSVFLNARRGIDPATDLMRLALLRYGARDFAVAEARLERTAPGGEVKGTFRILHGQDNVLVGTVELTAKSPSAVPAMLAEAVTRLDEAMNQALEDGRLKASEVVSAEDMVASAPEDEQSFALQSIAGIEVLVDTPDAQSWSALEQQLRRAPSITGLAITGLSLGGISQVRLGYASSMEWLQYDLDQLGLRLGLLSDGRWMLRPRQPDEPPLPRPAVVENVGEEGVVTQVPATPGQPNGAPQPGGTGTPAPLLPPGFGQQPRNPQE